MNEEVLQQAFMQARLKVKRAYRHLDEAQRWFAAYCETDFCKIVEELDPQSGSQLFRVKADWRPAGLALAIGDAFHNLSASLDYVMTGLMLAAGASTKRVIFPTHVSRHALRKSFMTTGKKAVSAERKPANRRIVECIPAFAMLMLARIKPYQGGNFRTWEVRKADNINKHNMIIPALLLSNLNGVVLEDRNNNSIFKLDFHILEGGIINAIQYRLPSRLEIREHGKPSASVIFDDMSEIFPGEPVFPTLLQCCQLVGEAIDVIAAEPWRMFVRHPRA